MGLMEGLHSFLSPFWARKGDVGLQSPSGSQPRPQGPCLSRGIVGKPDVPGSTPALTVHRPTLTPCLVTEGTSQAFLRRGLGKVGGLPRPQPVPAAGVGVPQAWASNRAQPCSEQYGKVFASLCPSWAAGLKAKPRYAGAVCPQASPSASLSSHWKPG